VPTSIVAVDDHERTDAVDGGRAERTDQAEGDEEDPPEQRRLDAGVAHPAARRSNASCSRAPEPNSLTRLAPATLKRSVIWVFIAAL
jgi:hypothetical protein